MNCLFHNEQSEDHLIEKQSESKMYDRCFNIITRVTEIASNVTVTNLLHEIFGDTLISRFKTTANFKWREQKEART